MFLAEEKEPEFAWGHGRRKGSKNKQLAPANSNEVVRQRRHREQKARDPIPDPDIST
jgi:hypothetical protein